MTSQPNQNVAASPDSSDENDSEIEKIVEAVADSERQIAEAPYADDGDYFEREQEYRNAGGFLFESFGEDHVDYATELRDKIEQLTQNLDNDTVSRVPFNEDDWEALDIALSLPFSVHCTINDAESWEPSEEAEERLMLLTAFSNFCVSAAKFALRFDCPAGRDKFLLIFSDLEGEIHGCITEGGMAKDARNALFANLHDGIRLIWSAHEMATSRLTLKEMVEINNALQQQKWEEEKHARQKAEAAAQAAADEKAKAERLAKLPQLGDWARQFVEHVDFETQTVTFRKGKEPITKSTEPLLFSKKAVKAWELITKLLTATKKDKGYVETTSNSEKSWDQLLLRYAAGGRAEEIPDPYNPFMIIRYHIHPKKGRGNRGKGGIRLSANIDKARFNEEVTKLVRWKDAKRRSKLNRQTGN